MRQNPGKPGGKRSGGPGGGAGKPTRGRQGGTGSGPAKGPTGAAPKSGKGNRAPAPRPGAPKAERSRRAAEGEPREPREPRTFKAKPGRGATGEGFGPKPRSARAPEGEGFGPKPRSPRAPEGEGFGPRARSGRPPGSEGFGPKPRSTRAPEGGGFGAKNRYGRSPEGEGPGRRAPEGEFFGPKPRSPRGAEGEPRTYTARPGKTAPGEGFGPKPRSARPTYRRDEDGKPPARRGPGETTERARPAPREAAKGGTTGAEVPKRPLRNRAEVEAALGEAESPDATMLEARDAAEAAGADFEAEIVWGRHAVLEALKGDRPVNKVWLLRGTEDVRFAGNVRRLAREKGAVLQEVERVKLNDLAPATHQGVVASLAPVAYAELEDIVEVAKAAAHPLVLVLDGIEDPHNLGALIRTAGAAGAHGVIIPRRRAVGLTGAVAKSAAGALEHVPVARVNNIVQALETLKKAGFWVAGADQDAPGLAYQADLNVPLALVVGAEGEGVSRLAAETCDLLVRFPMEGAVPSLNASVAGALLLFEAVRQRTAASQTGPGPD